MFKNARRMVSVVLVASIGLVRALRAPPTAHNRSMAPLTNTGASLPGFPAIPARYDVDLFRTILRDLHNSVDSSSTAAILLETGTYSRIEALDTLHRHQEGSKHARRRVHRRTPGRIRRKSTPIHRPNFKRPKSSSGETVSKQRNGIQKIRLLPRFRVNRLSGEERSAFQFVFDMFDRSGNGGISPVEFAHAVADLTRGESSSDVRRYFDELDKDHDGSLSFQEIVEMSVSDPAWSLNAKDKSMPQGFRRQGTAVGVRARRRRGFFKALGSLLGGIIAGLLGLTPGVEDCVACRMVWSQVELKPPFSLCSSCS